MLARDIDALIRDNADYPMKIPVRVYERLSRTVQTLIESNESDLLSAKRRNASEIEIASIEDEIEALRNVAGALLTAYENTISELRKIN